jgi:hypothetical protein
MPELTSNEHIAVLNSTMTQLTSAMKEFTAEIKEVRKDVSDNYVRKDVYGSDQKAVWKMIGSHQRWLVWGQSLVIGAVLLAVIGVALKASGTV